MAYEFPTENLVPGQIEEVPQADGSVVRYRWTDPPGVWKILSTGGDGGPGGPVTTADVLTMGVRPGEDVNPFMDEPDPNAVATQQNANWFLWDSVNDLETEVEKISGLTVDRRLFNYVGVDSTPQAGQFASDSNVIASVTKLYFGVRDLNDEPTPIKSEGDQVTITGETVRTTFVITNVDTREGLYDVAPVTSPGVLENLEPYLCVFGVDTSALSARVLVGEIRQEALTQVVNAGVQIQGEIQEDVALLEDKVNALEGGIVDGRWSFESDNRLPSRGEFALRNDGAVSTVWSEAQTMLVNTIDRDGNSYTFEKVTPNDVIRLGAPDGSGAEYRITEIGATGTFLVDFILGTGVPSDEAVYSFTFLSAFDPAGLATIDYVDARDSTKLNLSGGTMTGGLVLDNARNLTFRKDAGQNQFAINPNVTADYFTNIYTFNSADGEGGVRFRVSQDQNLGSSSYDTLVSLSGATQTIGGVEYRGLLALNRLRTPETPDQAANKWYVDNAVGDVDLSDYLPLTGGDMTGDINMMNSRLDTFNADGVQTMEIAPSGFIKTRDMLRVVRATGPILEGRQEEDAGSTTTKIWSDGTYEFRGPGRLYDDVNIYDNHRLVLRGTNNNNVGYIEATSNNQMTIAGYSGKTINIKNLNAPSANTDAATKIYVDAALAPFVTSDEVDTKINTETVHLPLAGGTMDGRLNIEMADQAAAAIRTIGSINVKADSELINGANNFIAHKDYVKVFSTPSAQEDVVNKKYLDEAIAGVALKKFLVAPARLAWKFNSTSTGDSAPPDESFKITTNGSDTYIRYSFKTYNGTFLGDAPFSDTNVSIDNGPVGTIWYWHWEAEDWRLKEQFRINSFRWNYKNHFEMRMTSRHGSKSYTVGTNYYITVGGFF